MAPQSRGKAWCFTLNNPTSAEVELLHATAELAVCSYMILGNEVGESGTPHIQGYVEFTQRKTLGRVKDLLGRRTHVEPRRGTGQQAAAYCRKDGDYREFGSAPTGGQGTRNDINEFVAFIQGCETRPTMRECIQAYPSLYVRAGNRMEALIDAFTPAPQLQLGDYRVGWQTFLHSEINEDAHPRKIRFVVDPEGGKGKTWFAQKVLTQYPDRVQYMRPAKRDDLAYAIDETKCVFIIDVPRSQMEFAPYAVMEMLKDRLVFSPKYGSRQKVLTKTPHVIIFSNEEPDREKLSADRPYILHI